MSEAGFELSEIILVKMCEATVCVTELVFKECGSSVRAGVELGGPGLLHEGGVMVQGLCVAVSERLPLSREHARFEGRGERSRGGVRLEHVAVVHDDEGEEEERKVCCGQRCMEMCENDTD